MDRQRVLHENIVDEATASALREFAGDRSGTLARLTEAFMSDPQFRGAWLWGSFGRGDADDLSDLDIWLAVDDRSIPTIGLSLMEILPAIGEWVCGGENPNCAPVDGGYIGARYASRYGTVHLDLYWQSHSSIDSKPDVAVQLNGFASSTDLTPIFDRQDEPIAIAFSAPSISHISDRDETVECVTDGIDFMTLLLPIAAKKLARDPQSDMQLVLYPKPGFEKAVEALDAAGIVGPIDWDIPAERTEKVALLRHLVEKTILLTQLAGERQIPIPRQYGPCLDSYMTMIEGIVRDRA